MNRRSSGKNRQSMRRIVVKQGYLKKIPNAAKFGSSMKKPERRWFVFGVMNFQDPYLEYYENEEALFQNNPINIIFLEGIIRVIRDQKTQRYQNMFSLILKDRHLSLVAQTRESMYDWSRTFEAKFRELGLIDVNVGGENDYVDIPSVTRPNRNNDSISRDPLTSISENSTDALAIETNPQCSNNDNSDESQNNSVAYSNGVADRVYSNVGPGRNSHLLRRNRPKDLNLQNTITVNGTTQGNSVNEEQNRSRGDNGVEGDNDDVYENLWERNNRENDYAVPSMLLQRDTSNTVHNTDACHSSLPLSNNDNDPLINNTLQQEHDEVQEIAMDISRSPMGNGASNSRSYHRLHSNDSSGSDMSPRRSVPQSPFPPSYTPQTPTTPSSALQAHTPTTPLSPYPGVFLNSPLNSPRTPSLIPDKMREALGMDTGDTVAGWSMAPPVADDAPPPYMPKGMLERGANKSLKVSQVEHIRKQQNNPGGVKVILKRIDCHHTIALVHCFDGVWIAGWNQTARPFLQTAFHIGDQLISINGQVIETPKMAYKLIKHCSENDKITFIIKRVPNAKLFTFKRMINGEDLGFSREGGTGEVVSVNPSGIACQQGMPTKSQTMEGDNLCTWYITEINNRPLNMFYKDKEIEHRLKAVGMDISIMIQPSQLVMEFKRQLKSMKYYKDYIVQ